MKYIINLYDSLNSEQKALLNSLGKITHESKFAPMVILNTDATKEELYNLKFIKSIQVSRNGEFIQNHRTRSPLTMSLLLTHHLLEELNESIGGHNKYIKKKLE